MDEKIDTWQINALISFIFAQSLEMARLAQSRQLNIPPASISEALYLTRYILFIEFIAKSQRC